jgi:hypothetical protein
VHIIPEYLRKTGALHTRKNNRNKMGNPQKFLDIYKANDSDFQKSNIRIYHGYQMLVLSEIIEKNKAKIE